LPAVVTLTVPTDPGTNTVPAVRRRRPRLLVGASVVVAAVLVLPLVFLIWQAGQLGWGPLSSLLFRQLTATLLWNTVKLCVAVTAASAVIGTAAAWCTERTDLPGRRLWVVLVVIPVAIPDFVVSFGWVSIDPSLHGFLGATLVMTLAVYPLVYLPVAASFRGADPGQEEVARSLGLGRVATFWRVTLAQARTALFGGCLLVSLALLAEYGAFEILRYQTFTTEIFTEFQDGFNPAAACGLSLVLVLLGLVLLTADGFGRSSGRTSRSGPQAVRVRPPHRLGRATVPVLVGFLLLSLLALGVPIGALIYWLVQGGRTTLPAAASLSSAAAHSIGYSAAAAALTTVAAVPVALLSVRHPGRSTMALERSTFLVLALPGIVIALALVFFSERYIPRLYQHGPLLIVAYAILFFPLALVAVRASVAQAPIGLEEVARALGCKPWTVLWRVTFPLVAPGLAAAFCLVFLSAVTELTSTLILIPTGAQTLATQFWTYTTGQSFGAAAPYAGLMVVIAVIPSYLLGRWFNRLPAKATPTPL
jgi:iron(III) transport system permease protein